MQRREQVMHTKVIEQKEHGSFYYKKDNTEGFLSIALGCKNEDPKKRLEAKIAPKEGSNLFSFKVGENETIYYDPELPLADFLVGTPVLFPFPNRIENAMWTWKGKTYLQKKNGIPVQLHSLVYDEKSWEYNGPEFGSDSVSLTTFIDINEAHPIYKGYPFKCRLSLIFQLTSVKLSITYMVENKDTAEIPFGFALHPYFTKLSGETGTQISVPCQYWYEARTDVDETFLNKLAGGFSQVPNILPTGKLMDADTEGNNLKSAQAVGDLNLDHVYTGCLEGKNAYIDYTSLKMKLNIKSSSDFTHAVVFTPQGKPYFCIEPQTCSTDAINLHARGIENAHLMILPAGQSHTGTVDFMPEHY